VTQAGRLQKPSIVMLLINDPKKAANCERNTKLKPIKISQKTRPSIEETGQESSNRL